MEYYSVIKRKTLPFAAIWMDLEIVILSDMSQRKPNTMCAVLYLVTQLYQTLCNSMDCSLPGSSVHGDSPSKNTGVGCHALLQGNLPNPGIESRSPALQADSLPAEPAAKPKNTGVGSPSLLQENFPTQELNRDLLHCRWTLYQLSNPANPRGTLCTTYFWIQ